MDVKAAKAEIGRDKPATFLDLPAELRNQIYGLAKSCFVLVECTRCGRPDFRDRVLGRACLECPLYRNRRRRHGNPNRLGIVVTGQRLDDRHDEEDDYEWIKQCDVAPEKRAPDSVHRPQRIKTSVPPVPQRKYWRVDEKRPPLVMSFEEGTPGYIKQICYWKTRPPSSASRHSKEEEEKAELWDEPGSFLSKPPNLTRVSRQVREDTLPIFYGSNNWVIRAGEFFRDERSGREQNAEGGALRYISVCEKWYRWLKYIGPVNAGAIRRLKVDKFFVLRHPYRKRYTLEMWSLLQHLGVAVNAGVVEGLEYTCETETAPSDESW